MNTYPRTLTWITLALALLAPTCKKDTTSSEAGDTTTVSREIKIEVKNDSGVEQLAIELEPDAIEVTVEGRVLQARRLDEKKHEYKADDGSVVLVVKHQPDGMKIQAPDGDTLVAKVKRKDGGRLKLSDNEHNEHALEIRPQGANEANVERDGKSLGRVVFQASSGRTRVQDPTGKTLLRATLDHPLFALGALLDDRVSETARYVATAELLNEALR